MIVGDSGYCGCVNNRVRWVAGNRPANRRPAIGDRPIGDRPFEPQYLPCLTVFLDFSGWAELLRLSRYLSNFCLNNKNLWHLAILVDCSICFLLSFSGVTFQSRQWSYDSASSLECYFNLSFHTHRVAGGNIPTVEGILPTAHPSVGSTLPTAHPRVRSTLPTANPLRG